MRKYRALRMVSHEPPGARPTTFDVGQEFSLADMKGPTGIKQAVITEWLAIGAIEEVSFGEIQGEC